MGSGSGSSHGASTTGIFAFLGVWALTATILSGSGYTGAKAFMVGLCAAVIAYQLELLRSHADNETHRRRRGRWGIIALSLGAGVVVIVVAAASSSSDPGQGGTSANNATPTTTPPTNKTPTATPTATVTETPTATQTPSTLELSLPGTERWADVRVAASEYDFRGEPLEFEVARLRVFVAATRRCLWEHVRTGDALTIAFERKRYAFEVTRIESYPAAVELVPSRRTVSRPTPDLVCDRG